MTVESAAKELIDISAEMRRQIAAFVDRLFEAEVERGVDKRRAARKAFDFAVARLSKQDVEISRLPRPQRRRFRASFAEMAREIFDARWDELSAGGSARG